MLSKVTCIGVGNRFRNDDGLGWHIAKIMQAEVPEIEILEASGEGMSLLEIMQQRKFVFIFDAVNSGSDPGTVFRFQADSECLPSKFFHYSTHEFSVAEAIELGRSLKQLPEKLIVYGIEGKNFRAGTELSEEVEKSIPEVVEQVKVDLDSWENVMEKQ